VGNSRNCSDFDIHADWIIVIILKQPELAVLEGMELVQYKQVTLGSKTFTPIAETPAIPDPKKLANGKTIEGAESQ